MRFYVKQSGVRSGRFYTSMAGGRRSAKRKSLLSEGEPVTAVAESYNPDLRDYEIVGTTVFVNGYVDDERGVFADAPTP